MSRDGGDRRRRTITLRGNRSQRRRRSARTPIVNVRDNSLKTCFAVFIAESTEPAPSGDRIELTELHNAVAARDQRLAELLAGTTRTEARSRSSRPTRSSDEWQADNAQVEFALTRLSNMFARLENDLLRAPRMAMTVVPQPCVQAEPSPR